MIHRDHQLLETLYATKKFSSKKNRMHVIAIHFQSWILLEKYTIMKNDIAFERPLLTLLQDNAICKIS